jgi:hypothetical protein
MRRAFGLLRRTAANSAPCPPPSRNSRPTAIRHVEDVLHRQSASGRGGIAECDLRDRLAQISILHSRHGRLTRRAAPLEQSFGRAVNHGRLARPTRGGFEHRDRLQAPAHASTVLQRLVGRSPSYLARQMYDMKLGTRKGAMTALMMPVLANLTDADIVDLVAYLSSREP